LSDQSLQVAGDIEIPDLGMAGLVSFRVDPYCQSCHLVARIHSSLTQVIDKVK
jgi:collagenase-like PrtC family protease